MKNLSLTVILVLLASIGAWSQQDPYYSQYLFNPLLINPAHAGFSKDLTALAANRIQWVSFPGSPRTINASAHASMVDNKVGAGLILLQDQIGISKSTEVHMNYAYHVEFSKGHRLSLGLQAGFMDFQNDYSELIIDPNDPKFQTNISEFTPSFGGGFIYSADNFYLGAAIPKMLKASATIDGSDIVLYDQHFYAYTAYVHTLTYRIKAKPFAMVRSTAQAPLSWDFGVLLTADESYSIGFLTRSLHTYGGMVRLNIGENFFMGYVFELPTNRSVGINFAAHEVTLGVRLAPFSFHNLSNIVDF